MKTNKYFFPKIKGRKLEVIAQRFRGYITIDGIKKLEAKRMYKKSKLTRNTSWTSRLKEYWPAPKRLISKHNLHMPCRTNKFCCYFMEETTSKLMHEFKHWQKHVVAGQYSNHETISFKFQTVEVSELRFEFVYKPSKSHWQWH